MAAPVVVAKGRNLLAAQIKEIARWENIPMVENPPLAHVLYRTVEVGQSVPPKLYTVIAEILAAIYRAQARATQLPLRGGSSLMAALPPTTAAAPAREARCVEWIVPIAAVSLVFVMLVPLPAILLDLLLATSITASVLVLLSALQILRPAQFSVFPSLLLLLTLFRLSLNLASSRRILLHGNEGAAAAGRVIEAFGQFVVGGNYVVGFVLFIALIAIQYIVVSHGAVRTAEVTARFTLDAMPGKQMAIDADLNAGLIDEAPGARPPRTDRARSRVLRRHGRRRPLQPARLDRHHSDHRHQHRRRLSDRRLPARHSLSARRSRPTPCSPSATAWSR